MDIQSFPVPPVGQVDLAARGEEVHGRADPDLAVITGAEFEEQVGSATAIFNAILVGIALISLAVGGLSVINTMAMSVAERTREIGIKRAIGGSRTRIVGELVAESALIGFLGGVIVAAHFVVPWLFARIVATRSRKLFTLSIAHMDCDAFYASVEKRDNPELEGKLIAPLKSQGAIAIQGRNFEIGCKFTARPGDYRLSGGVRQNHQEGGMTNASPINTSSPCWLKQTVSMRRRFSSAIRSMAGTRLTSVAVVITGRPPVMPATSRARALAPPRCPDTRLMANCPFSSHTTTAGSLVLWTRQSPMLRTTIPVAMIKM